MFAVFRRRWKPKKAGSGRKQKEKLSSESQESADGSRESADRASKMGHQVHPEHRAAITIDKVNVMVNLDGKWDKKDLDTSPLAEEIEPLVEKLRPSPTMGKTPSQTNNTKEPPTKVRVAPFTTSLCHENRTSTDSVSASDRDTWISGQSDKEVWMLGHSEKDSCHSDRSSFESDKSSSWVANESENEDLKCSYNHRERPIGEDREHPEKTDVIKELLEKRILELEHLLEKEKRDGNQTPQELLQKELEREKAQRQEVENRLQDISQENELAKTRLSKLQQDFTKLEEMVCGMIQYKSRMDWLQQEKTAISLTYEARLHKYQNYISNLEKENLILLGEVKTLEASNKQNDDRERSLSQVLLERLRYLETENSSLVLETEQQRLQYERCLDDVANQVVQALLVQKGLREDCVKLRKHVADLEQNNRILRLMYQKQINIQTDSIQQVLINKSPTLSTGKVASKANNQKCGNQSSMATQTSHSEDSLESLASLCSEYSLQSNGSGSIQSNTVGINIPGLPQLSSPPLWIRECLMHCRSGMSSVSRQSQDCEDLLSNFSAMPHETLAKFPDDVSNSDTIWPGLQLKDLEELVTGEESLYRSSGRNGPGEDRAKKSNFSDDTRFQIKELKSDKADLEDALEKSPSVPSLSEALDSLSSACLDAVETPNEEALNFVSLPLPTSNQKLCIANYHHPISQLSKTLQSLNMPIMSSGSDNMQQKLKEAMTRNIALRPKSLDLIPQHLLTKNIVQQELLGHHYDYPSLEFKNHSLCSGNVYTSPNAKPFPPNGLESSLCFASALSKNFHDRKLQAEQYQFPAIAKSTHRNPHLACIDSPSSLQTISGEESGAGSTEISPKLVSSASQETENHCQLSASSLSVNGKLKDEGYSTMSSDVQCEQLLANSSTTTSITSPTLVTSTAVTEILETGTILKRILPEQANDTPANQNNADKVLADSLRGDEEDEDSEECQHAFENDLEQSLIILHDFQTKQEDAADTVGEYTSNLNNLSNDNMEASSHIKDDVVVSDSTSVEIQNELIAEKPATTTVGLSILSTNRMVSLCTPQGFKARPPRITFPSPHNIETADKGTETDPVNCSNACLNESNVSLSSTNSVGRTDADISLFQSHEASYENLIGSQRSSVASASDSDCVELLTRSTFYFGTGKLSELKIVEDNDSDEFFMPIPCHLHSAEKSIQSFHRQPLFKHRIIQRSVSDSDLYSSFEQQQFSFIRSFSLSCQQNSSGIPEKHVTTGSLEFLHEDIDNQNRGNLWRSKATVSLADDEDDPSKSHLISQNLQSSWQFECSGQSLNSLQSLASDDGEYKCEATINGLSTEGMCDTCYDSDREAGVECSKGVDLCSTISNSEFSRILKQSTAKDGSRMRNAESTSPQTVREYSSIEDSCLPSQLSILPAIEEGEFSEGQEEEEWKNAMSGTSRASWLSSKGFTMPEQRLSRCSTDPDQTDSVQGSEDSDLRHVGIEFHSDFYHLCKVDSLSLNVSSKSLSVSEAGSSEKEGALGINSSHIDGEKCKYVSSDDSSLPSSEQTVIEVEGCNQSVISDKIRKTDSSIVIEDNVSDKSVKVVKIEVISVQNQNSLDNSQGEEKDLKMPCNLNDKTSTREKLEELTALLAVSNTGDEEEETVANEKEHVMIGPQGKEGFTTSWVHIETDVDLTDPKTRANLLDTMLASSSSSSSSECGEEPPEYHHLHQLHRYRRHRKATELENCMLRYIPPTRPSIIGRRDFFFRYGEQEQAAVASFDFLEDMSTSVSDFGGSAETLSANSVVEKGDQLSNTNLEIIKDNYPLNLSYSYWSQKCPDRMSIVGEKDERDETDEPTLLRIFHSNCNSDSTTTLNSHDCELPERLSLSDSCAESYSSSNQSLNAME